MLALGFALPLGLAACGTDAAGIDSCRTLEAARCERAASCEISLANPPHEGAPEKDVAACKRFYRDACLHGLVSQAEPGELEVEACRAAIETGSCEIVRDPTLARECVFLLEEPPVETPDDAGADGADLTEQLDGQSPF